MTAIDLRTRYLGLDLPHPVVASASPLTRSVEGICQLADAGAAAVVMASIYEEQIVAAELAELALLEADGGTHPEASGGFFPATVTERSVLDQRLETLRRAAERAGIPVIASLNGVSRAGWTDFAGQLEQAGAAAIELNVFRIPADLSEDGPHIDRECVEVLRAVKASVGIPVSVKLSPFHSSTGHFALQLVQAGHPPPEFKAGGGKTRGGGVSRHHSNHSGCASSCACACASSCACACACAGGGRAGCSVKDFYTVKLPKKSVGADACIGPETEDKR